MTASLDITGHHYGQLRVIKFCYKEKGHKYWECKCSCGKTVVVRQNNLRTGHTVSCGCAKEREDLTGKRFGLLKVISYSHNKYNVAHWLCKCSCGNTTVVQASHLNAGSTRSCGCISAKEDLSGLVFGHLTVIGFAYKRVGHLYWKCKCDCGFQGELVVESGNLRSGHTSSCGCHQKSRTQQTSTTHGMSNSRLYNIWVLIRDRCLNKKNPDYKNYGGRGITICDRWLTSFENFYADMGDPPSNEHQIDRIDNNMGYYPDNCRWATRKDQARNRRNNIWIDYKGECKTLPEWVEQLGLKYKLVYGRLLKGWSIERAFEK